MDILKQIRFTGFEMYKAIHFYTNTEYLNSSIMFFASERLNLPFFLLFSVFTSSESKVLILKIQKGEI